MVITRVSKISMLAVLLGISSGASAGEWVCTAHCVATGKTVSTQARGKRLAKDALKKECPGELKQVSCKSADGAEQEETRAPHAPDPALPKEALSVR